MSLRKISLIHKVAQSTLHELVKEGKTFSGSGRNVGKYFTKKEEDRLADKMRNLAYAGHEITWASMLELVKKELSLLGKGQVIPNTYFVRRFAKRQDLAKHVVNLSYSFRNKGALHMWPHLDEFIV